MKPEVMLQELERAAEELGVQVSYESLGASIGLGGLCRVKGHYRVIIEKRASVDERVTTLSEALTHLDTSSLTSLSPPTRRLLARGEKRAS